MPAAPVPMELEGSTFINEHHPAYVSGAPAGVPSGGFEALVAPEEQERRELEREWEREKERMEQEQRELEEEERRPRVGSGPVRAMPESPEEIGRGF